MPLGYRFDGRWVTIECPGHYSVEDFCANVAAAVSDPAWPAEPLVLFDLSERAAGVRRTRAEELEMVRCVGAAAGRIAGRFAVVAPQDLHYGIMRVTAVDMQRYGIEVFVARSEEGARAWLLDGRPESI